MHAYSNPQDQSYWSITALQLPEDLTQNASTTPIYDALYKEWADSFRSTPGDRSGEEKLDFAAFGRHPQCTTWGTGCAMGLYGNSPNTDNAKAHSTPNSAQRQGDWQRVALLGQHATGMHGISSELQWEEAPDTRMVWSLSAYEAPAGEAVPVTPLAFPVWPSSA